MFNFSRETMEMSNTNKEPRARNEYEYREMLKNKYRQSQFFREIYPILEKYNFVLSFGESVGMHVYNAIVELFESDCLKPFWDDYNRLKKRVEELEKEKEIVKEWLGKGDTKTQDASVTTPRLHFEDVFPPSQNGYLL